MEENVVVQENGLDSIANYIKDLRFKKAVVGGIDQENAYQAMRKLVSMFTEVYTAETEKNAELEKRLEEASKSGIDEKLQAFKEQAARRIEEVIKENDDLKRKLESLDLGHNSDKSRIASLETELKSANEENRKLSSQLEEANSKLKTESFQHETLEDIYLDANRKRIETLENASKEAETMIRNAHAEVEQIAADKERAQAEYDAFVQELDGSRKERQEKADQEAAEKRQQTQALCDEMIQQAEEKRDATLKAAEEKASTLIAEAEVKSAGLVRDAEQASEAMHMEAEAQKEAMLKKAQEESDHIHEEADNYLANVKAAFLEDRKKYDLLLRQLATLRSETLRRIQEDANRLQSLAFDLADNGITAVEADLCEIDYQQEQIEENGNP